MTPELALRSRAATDATRARRRRQRLLQELAVRGTVAFLILVFNELFSLSTGGEVNRVIRNETLLALLLNVPYYLAARTGWAARAQAYVRMLGDVGFITLGLASAGGLAAAPFVAIYAIVPLYVGLVFSSFACVIATAAAMLAYLTVVLVAPHGWPPSGGLGTVSDWEIVAFNLLILTIVGGLTALLSEAYRRSRLRVAAAHQELERAHEQSLVLNAEIQRASQLRVLGEVVAGVTHELSNVLMVACGHMDIARNALADSDPDIRKHLDHVAQSFDTAMRILRTTLDTARQSADEPQALSVADLARRVVALKRYELRREEIDVDLQFAPTLPLVRAVPFQLQQVLLNLVTNAQQVLRTAPAPRRIEVAGTSEGGRVMIEVRDSGPGIAADALPRIFEPFFTTKAEGTGLGLAISAGIARDLGGTLTAANRAGGGAVFRLDLPALGKSLA